MSSARRGSSKSQSQSGEKGEEGGKPPVEFLPPLKPRPMLAIGLFIVLLLWLGALVVMRFTSVKPYVNPATAPATQ